VTTEAGFELVSGMDAVEKVIALEREIVARTAALLERLRALEQAAGAFEPSFKDDLQELIAALQALAERVEEAPAAATGQEARALGTALARALEGWRTITESLDRTVSLAVQGRIDRRFMLLSPIANCANLGERRRLARLRDRLAEAVQKAAAAAPRPLVLDLDLVAPEEAASPLRQASPDETLPLAPPERPARPEDGDEREFEGCLARLLEGDELERSEALADAIRRHQHLLVARLLRGASRREGELDRIMAALWRHAEELLLEDYFFSARRLKLLPLLGQIDACPASVLFAGLLGLFRASAPRPEQALAGLPGACAAETDTLLRTMLVHPRPDYRRYAAGRVPPSRYWPIACSPEVPVPALAEMLDRLAQDDVNEDHRKIFFDCTARALAAGRTEADVRAARRMMTTYFGFEFFVEDDYFRKILALDEGVARCEARLGIADGCFRRLIEAFRKDKEATGLRGSRMPRSFVEVPLAVQRKLAREGFYVTLFVRHPHPKIALETLRHIKTPAAAEAVLQTRTASALVVGELAKREDLLTSYGSRLALVAHPRATLEAARRYVPHLRPGDLRRLAQSHDTSPEVGAYLRSRLATRAV
jgi:hypothetical protein